MPAWLYLAACVVVPAAWGLLVSWAYDTLEARLGRQRPADDEGADMYHI